MSKAAGGVSKIINLFEDQALIKPKSSMHSHKSSSENEKKISGDLKKLKPFSVMPGRFHASFTGISSNPLEDFNEVKFGEWLQRHKKKLPYIFLQLTMLMLRMLIFIMDMINEHSWMIVDLHVQ